MLNMLESRVFRYASDAKEVTVYQDDVDLNKWYIVPEPTFATTVVGGQPMAEFALVQYKTQEGAAGTCAFVVELTVSPEARAAVRANLGDEISYGQLDWQSAETYFYYQIAGEEQVRNAVPSLVGTNRSAFVISLETQEAVNTFVNAFGPGSGAVSPFRIDYDVTALARLQAVEATVTYNSQLAFEYEKTVSVTKNVWGKVTSRRETVKEQLRQSDAGAVELTFGIEDPSAELQQRVNDWAWITLEGLVNKAIDDAMRFVGDKNADEFSLAATASFERVYTENQVISWGFSPTAFFQKFTEEQWKNHFSEVDNRRLIVNFNILDDLGSNGIDSVGIDVEYDGAPHSHLYLPSDPSTWQLDIDGNVSSGSFDPDYSYRYTVKFTDEPTKTFVSNPIKTSNTEVVLPVASLGSQTASFVGSNIDFDQVDFVLVDFYFVTPGDQPNTAQQKKMIDNQTKLEFVSKTFLPSTNEYNYAATYVMKDGNRYVQDPIVAFPPDNRSAVTIVSAFRVVTFYPGVLNRGSGDPIVQAQLTGTYDDNVNGINESQNWNIMDPAVDTYTKADEWNISVIGNPNGSKVVYNGFLITGDGQQRPITNLVVQATQPFLNLSAIDTPYSVVIDPSQVKWETNSIDQISIDLFRLEGDPLENLLQASANRTQRKNVLVRPLPDGNGRVLDSAAGLVEQYYNFNYPVGKPAIYYYSAQYNYTDGTTKYLAEASSDSQRVVLPSNATSGQLRIFRAELPHTVEIGC